MLFSIAAEESTLRWAAARACGAWFQPVRASLCLIHNMDNLEKLGLSMPDSLPRGVDQLVDNELPWLADQRSTLKKFHEYTMQLSSFRAWSQVQFSTLVPQLLAGVHHVDRAQRISALGKLRTTWDAVLAAEAVVYRHAGHEDTPVTLHKMLSKLLDDVAWHRLQLSREIYSVAAAGNWSVDDQQLRLLSFLLWARPVQTKFVLEDIFAHLGDVAARHNKNQTMQRCLIVN